MIAFVLGSSPAPAGLVGDSVTASYEDLDTSTAIFSGSAVVVEPGAEFVGVFGLSTWTLDIGDLGFTLTGVCTDLLFGCDFPAGTRLTLSGLDFTPPAALVGLLGISGDLAAVADPPVVTPSSVTITFASFILGTGTPETQSYSARFDLEPLSTVPLPAALLLVGAGGLGLVLLSRRARR
jgi:hypothetical protein